jgi:hypothetical protein
MIPLPTRFCVGCGHIFDELWPSDGVPSWVPADAFRKKYGFGLDYLRLLEDTCPPCARVFAIGRRETVRVQDEWKGKF